MEIDFDNARYEAILLLLSSAEEYCDLTCKALCGEVVPSPEAIAINAVKNICWNAHGNRRLRLNTQYLYPLRTFIEDELSNNRLEDNCVRDTLKSILNDIKLYEKGETKCQ